jgi:hypothetical protein
MADLSSNQFFHTTDWNPFTAIAHKVDELSNSNIRYQQAVTQHAAHNKQMNNALPAAPKPKQEEHKMTDYQINDKANRRSKIESNTSNIGIGPKNKTKNTPPGTKPKKK